MTNKAAYKKLKNVVKWLRDTSSSEAVALSDLLEGSFSGKDLDLARAICDSMEAWARGARAKLLE